MMGDVAGWLTATTTPAFAAPPRRTWEDDDVMRGLMMDYPLTLTQFFERTRRPGGTPGRRSRRRCSAAAPLRARGWPWSSGGRAGALRGLGLQKGARVGTFAWN